MATGEPVIPFISDVFPEAAKRLSGIHLPARARCKMDPGSRATRSAGMTAELGRPRQRIGLHIGEALHRLDHAFLVAEPGILDAAERRHLDAIARHFPYVDGADVEFVDEARDVVEPVGADA